MATPSELIVLLQDAPVGTLNARADGGAEFRFFESYKAAYPQPVLGQRFLDDIDRTWKTRASLPDWFSNLLPEGALRELVALRANVSPDREFFLLRHLGEDLPGAVRIVAERDLASRSQPGYAIEQAQFADRPEWHFSLAGVQLKFSARRNERGLTIPLSGVGGDWIAKLPDVRFDEVPENEFATMRWAADSGIDVPETMLLDLTAVSGLPAEAMSSRERRVYAIRRFDRPTADRRVHIEDFAQVLGLYPQEKYSKYNYETIANVIAALVGEEGLREFVRRLVFVVGSGNGDAHHKNWSLIYPDGVTAQLSPAYDLVSTIQYMHDDNLALNFARSKRWVDVSIECFRRLARKLGRAESEIERMAEESVDAMLAAWSRSGGDYGYPTRARERIEQHLKSIPLFRAGRRH